MDYYPVGYGQHLLIKSEITNSGEDAFNAMLEVQLPRSVSYIKANTTDPRRKILCSPPCAMSNNTIKCEIGNPFEANMTITAQIYVMPKSDEIYEFLESGLSFLVSVSSSNPEKGTEEDNLEVYTVPIRGEVSSPNPEEGAEEDNMEVYTVPERGEDDIPTEMRFNSTDTEPSSTTINVPGKKIEDNVREGTNARKQSKVIQFLSNNLWLVYTFSALIGFFILAAITFSLYKVGFFERTRYKWQDLSEDENTSYL